MKKTEILPEWIYEFDVPGSLLADTLEHIEKLSFDTGILGRQVVLHRKPEFQFLREYFNDCLEEVRKDLELKCPQLETGLFWVNRSTFGQWHPVHKHSNSYASGIFYLTESGSSTWFSRDSLWADKGDMVIYGEATLEKVEIHKYPTTPGRVLIFPSKMMHSVNEHDIHRPRYTISFNSWPRGEFGIEEELTWVRF